MRTEHRCAVCGEMWVGTHACTTGARPVADVPDYGTIGSVAVRHNCPVLFTGKESEERIAALQAENADLRARLDGLVAAAENIHREIVGTCDSGWNEDAARLRAAIERARGQ